MDNNIENDNNAIEESVAETPTEPTPIPETKVEQPVEEKVETNVNNEIKTDNNTASTKKKPNIVKIIIWVVVLIITIILIIFFVIVGRIFGPTIQVKIDDNFIDAGSCGKIIQDPMNPNHEYDKYVELNDFDGQLYDNYADFPTLIRENVSESQLDFDNYNYYLFRVNVPSYVNNMKPISSTRKLSTVYVTMGYNIDGNGCGERHFKSLSYECYLAKTEKDKNITRVEVTDMKEMNGRFCSPFGGDAWKPMIYIYPEKEMNVSVKLRNSDLITTSYPKYIDGWNVLAKPNGDLEYQGRTYYGLYWEGKDYYIDESNEGFVIKGEDTSKFLEEKLTILGLSEREINEFIVYWLPKMEHNKYNYIRFDSNDNINSYMPLDIEPTPDTLIRVYMIYKPLDKLIDVKEQELEKVDRKGYTVVEWGGIEINK